MLNKIESKEGYVFALKDKSAVYDTIIYLGKYVSAGLQSKSIVI